MKKRIITYFSVLVILIASVTTSAYAATAEMNLWGFSSSYTVKAAKTLAASIGKMKKKPSKKFPSLYMTGNKVTIGINKKAKPGTSAAEYIRVENKGNKRFTINGIKIGTKKSLVIRKMKKAGFRAIQNGKYFVRGEAGYVTATYKSGKLKSWTYSLSPTG